MSVRLYRWAWAQTGTGSTALLVLLALVERADNHDHTCFPSQGQLADDAQLEVKAVGRALQRLQAAGLVTRTRRRRRDGSRTSDLFRLHPDVGASETRSFDADEAAVPRGQSIATFGPALPDREPEQKEPIKNPSSNPSPSVGASSDDFEAFFAAYPRREGKEAARRSWRRAITHEDPAVILDSAARYAEVRKFEDSRYTPHPATWLDDARWTDKSTASDRLSQKSRNAFALVAKLEAEEASHADHHHLADREGSSVLERLRAG